METSVKLVLGSITELCQVLGLKITEFFPYAMKQVYIEGLLKAFLSVASLFLVIFVCKNQKKWLEEAQDELALSLCIVIGGIVCLVVFAICGYEAITALLNPHYQAIKEIMGMVIVKAS